MNTYEFWNATDEEFVEVDADGFEEACYIMFGDGEYDYHHWELFSINDVEQ